MGRGRTSPTSNSQVRLAARNWRVLDVQALAIWPVETALREGQRTAVHGLEPVLQGVGPVRRFQQLSVDLDDKAGTDPDQIGIVGSVMDLAEAESVRNDGVAFGLGVADDVGSLRQRPIEKMQMAHCVAYACRTRPRNSA